MEHKPSFGIGGRGLRRCARHPQGDICLQFTLNAAPDPSHSDSLRKSKLLGCLSAGALAVVFCGGMMGCQHPHSPDVVATVNGKPILRADMEVRLPGKPWRRASAAAFAGTGRHCEAEHRPRSHRSRNSHAARRQVEPDSKRRRSADQVGRGQGSLHAGRVQQIARPAAHDT